MGIWTAPPEELRRILAGAAGRAYVVTPPERGRPRASHPALESLASAMEVDGRDFKGHSAVFLEVGEESGHLLGAFIHKTRRGQAAGGVRFWLYDSVEDYVRDGLRLSRGMGHKNALAGLWWGGGKGVIARRHGHDHRDEALRAAIYRDYGRFISGLRGCYVTAEDAGTRAEDMAWIHQTTRHATCIPQSVGGSGNPSLLTARGVIVAMEAALEWLGCGDLAGKTVATQGLGNVAGFMIQGLLERGVGQIVGVDVDPQAVEQTRRRFPRDLVQASVVGPHDITILETPCDVLAPNATGAVLNARTIPGIKAAVVCGGANNQLENADDDARSLATQGVLYVPDFLANRMGIVNCANEQYGVMPDDPAVLEHLDPGHPTGIRRRSMEIFERARSSGRTPAHEAQVLADELSLELHPIWGDRGQIIVESLVRDGWERREGS